jgi:hypothetical protein
LAFLSLLLNLRIRVLKPLLADRANQCVSALSGYFVSPNKRRPEPPVAPELVRSGMRVASIPAVVGCVPMPHGVVL